MDVYISASDIDSREVKTLKKLFSKYSVFVVAERSRSVLVNFQAIVAACNPERNCLFLRDSSVTLFDSTDIDEIFDDILCHKWDIFYLCKWLDYCEEYTKYIKLNEKFLAVRSHNPQGLQALVISPKIFNTVIQLKGEAELLSLIKSEKIKALAIVPNLFEFDIGKRDSDADIIKRFPCQSVFSSSPNIRSYVQNGGDPVVELAMAKMELEKTTFKPVPTKPAPAAPTTTSTKSGGWLDSFSYDDLTKALILAMIIGVIISCFRKK